jgi:hypothetical protein
MRPTGLSTAPSGEVTDRDCDQDRDDGLSANDLLHLADAAPDTAGRTLGLGPGPLRHERRPHPLLRSSLGSPPVGESLMSVS